MSRNPFFTTCILLGIALSAPACVSETTFSPNYGDLSARRAKAERSWKVLEEEKLMGFVVRFSEPEPKGNILLSVRNAFNQDLGLIDQLGRAWRYRLHEDPEWVSTGSTLQGVRDILRLGEGTRLQACPLTDLPSGR